MDRKVDISYRTLIFIAIFALALWLTYLILDLLLLLFVAIIFMSALSPFVKFFMKAGLPKVFAIAATYIIMIGILLAVLASFVPPLIEQSNKLITALPPLMAELFNLTNIDKSIVQSQLTEFTKNIFSYTLQFLSNAVALIFILVFTFYMLLEKDNLERRTSELFVGNETRVKKLLSKIEYKLGAWLRGQLFLSLVVGVLSYIGLLLLNIPYALPLALFAAFMEVVPVIGPIISAIPAIILSLTINPLLAAGTAAMYFVIQQLENHLIVPQVMKRAVGLNPLIVILAIAVGSRLLGIGGALLSVPFAVVVQIILNDILAEKKIEAKSLD